MAEDMTYPAPLGAQSDHRGGWWTNHRTSRWADLPLAVVRPVGATVCNARHRHGFRCAEDPGHGGLHAAEGVLPGFGPAPRVVAVWR